MATWDSPLSYRSHHGAVAVGKNTNQLTGVTGYDAKLPENISMAAPAAASGTYYLATHAADGTTVAINKAPDFIRNAQIVASGASTANVTINGLDAQGNPISETLALNGNTPVLGKKAFSLITSVVLPTVAVITISIGTGVKFGFDYRVTENTVFIALVDGVPDSTLGTVVLGSTSAGADYYGTWSPATAPNGAHNYSVYYIQTDLNAMGVNN